MGVGGSAMGRGLSPHIHLTQEVSYWSYMSVWMLVLGERRRGRREGRGEGGEREGGREGGRGGGKNSGGEEEREGRDEGKRGREQYEVSG